MKNFLVVLVILLSVAACEERRSRRAVKRNVNVYHLADGRTCYHDNGSDLWFWLYIANANGSPYYYSPVPVNVGSTPPEARWVAADPPSAEEITSTVSLETEMIATDTMGAPAVDADGYIVDVDDVAPDGSYGEASEPSEGGWGDSGDDSYGSSDDGGGGGFDSGDSGGDD